MYCNSTREMNEQLSSLSDTSCPPPEESCAVIDSDNGATLVLQEAFTALSLQAAPSSLDSSVTVQESIEEAGPAKVTAQHAAGAFPDLKANQIEANAELNTECPCCGKEAKLLCTRCRSLRYCSQVCQKAHWIDGHKEECISVEGRKIIVDIDDEENPENATANAVSLSSFVLKVQVALNSSVSPMIAYDNSRSVYFLINTGNCKKASLLDRTIRQTGDVHGSKAYFNAKIRARDQKLIIYLDQRYEDLGW